MKMTFIMFWSFLILFQGMFTYVDVFFEIEEVLADYELHQQKYGDNLSTFISKHFGNLKNAHKEEHKKEHREHKHHDNSEINTSTHFVCLPSFNTVKTVQEIISKTDNFYYKNKFSTFEKQKIFQPPQFS